MTDADRCECRNFAIMVWTTELLVGLAPTGREADEMIALAASYGPPKNSTEHGQRSRT